jgi:hypothetical protein
MVAGKGGATGVMKSRVTRIVWAAEAAYSPEIGEIVRMQKKWGIDGVAKGTDLELIRLATTLVP